MKFFEYATGRKYNINEATFSEKDLNKVVYNLVSLISRKAEKTFYHIHTHEFKRADDTSGVGEMYFCEPDNCLYRFNFESARGSSTITSIDYWADMRYIGKPTYTLHIPTDFNVVQSIEKMLPFFTTPGSVTEASWKKTADSIVYGVPLDHPDFKVELDKKKMLVAQNGISEINGLTKEIDAGQDLLEKQEEADPEVLFEDMRELVKLVLTTKQPSLIILGAPGIGKTYEVVKTIKQYLGSEGDEWAMLKGNISTFGLYKELFVNRDRLLVFDDADGAWDNQDSNNMLKAALDSNPERWISWSSNATINVSKMDKDTYNELLMDLDDAFVNDKNTNKLKLPSKFPFTGKVIFISNLNKNQIDDAVLSRSYSIDMTLSAKGILGRMKSILPHMESTLNQEEKEEVLEYISEIYGKNSSKLNLRTLVLALNARESGSEIWKRIIKYA